MTQEVANSVIYPMPTYKKIEMTEIWVIINLSDKKRKAEWLKQISDSGIGARHASYKLGEEMKEDGMMMPNPTEWIKASMEMTKRFPCLNISQFLRGIADD